MAPLSIGGAIIFFFKYQCISKSFGGELNLACVKIKQVMEFLSENYDIELNDAEEYFMAIISVGLSLNMEMRKDIASIYNQNKMIFFENARNFSGYNHVLLSNGDLEQEIYAKKTLGILLSAEQSELIKVKVLRLIKKYYKDVYIYAQNNNYDGFTKKLSAIEGTNKNLKLIETLIVLYFYTMKQINGNLVNLEVHKTYYKTVNFIRANDIPAGYIGKTNIDLVEFEIAEELNKRLAAH